MLQAERPAPGPLPDTKLIDELGQYKLKEWPGKIKDIEELKQKLQAQLDLPDTYGIPGWNKYGASAERKLAPGTGYFSKIKKDGRWYLLDPEGCAFFSAGPTCINVLPDCRIDGLEKNCDWLPARDDPVYQDMYTDRSWPEFDPDRRRKCRVFSFMKANLYKIFGKDWHEKWNIMISRQLKANGLNTIANWSDQDLLGKIPMPYVTHLERFPETKISIFRDFPDVLSHEYKEDAERCAKFLSKYKNDPYMIGYFLRNEPMWAFVNNLIIAEEVLRNPAKTACKEKLVEFLKKKYGNTQSFSEAWKRGFNNFNDLYKPLANASRLSEAAESDLRAFSRIMLEAYVAIPSVACRRAAPHHMNLGMRWAWISDPDIVTGWENFDVFSINCYFEDPTPALDNVQKLGVDLPVMIGEFHFGALDLGLTSTGLKGTLNQKERGKAYRYYCEKVAAHPYGAGCHWFQCFDQFPLGRFDGENYNIGLFDVCCLPNKEMMDAIRRTGETLYQVSEGSLPPKGEAAEFIPMVAF
jgi:hypothetical protein